jgi:flagellar basal-body rod protein FlgG
MIRSTYDAASAMMAQMARQLSISNNLSNVSTPGYKEETVAVDDFREMYLNRLTGDDSAGVGSLSTGVRLAMPVVNLSQGALSETGNPLDLAIAGNAFFGVQTPDGVQYTRNGSFQRNAEGQLVTGDGMHVLGQNGPITIPDGEVWVGADGTISVDGTDIDTLQLTTFGDDPAITPVGNGRYTFEGEGSQSDTAGVSQGYLEQSNVDLNKAMTEMLAASRSYSIAQKMLQLSDQTLGLAVNDLGKVG